MKESKKRRLSLLNDAMFFIVKILDKVTHPNEGFWKKSAPARNRTHDNVQKNLKGSYNGTNELNSCHFKGLFATSLIF